MKIKITHKTRYHYMDQVFLEPHIIRLTPRMDHHIQVVSKHMTVSPDPSGLNYITDNDGDLAVMVWFKGMANNLEVKAESVVKASAFNPFDFLIHPPSCLKLPMNYPAEWADLLIPYMSQEPIDPELKNYADQLLTRSEYQVVNFLINLCMDIYENFNYQKRDEGKPYPPGKTLKTKKGSCRDFVVLAMAVCQSLGLACRYTSGYYWSEDKEEECELHAWFETFLPGAGWRGFDPSHGIACDHHHIALSASADPARTMPVVGSYRGFASSRMRADVSIDLMN